MLKASDIKRAEHLVEKYDELRRSYQAVIDDRAFVYLRIMSNGKPSDFDDLIEQFATDYLKTRLVVLEDELLGIGVIVEDPIKAVAELAKQQESA